jgi:hypothetical protein
VTPAYRFGEKIAMRRGVKEMKKLYDAVESGTAPNPYRNLDQIATYAPKVLGDRAFAGMGGALGSGSEGVAYPVLSPHGASVLKIHDPSAEVYSPGIIEAKRHFVGHDIPNVAKIHEEVPMRGTLHGESIPAFLHEYVPGKEYDEARNAAVRYGKDLELSRAAQGLQEDLLRTTHNGHGVLDAGRHNMRVQPNGQIKVIDFVGAPEGQLRTPEQRGMRSFLRGNGMDAALSHHIVDHELNPYIKAMMDRTPETILRHDTAPGHQPRVLTGREYANRVAARAFGAKDPLRHVPGEPLPVHTPPTSQSVWWNHPAPGVKSQPGAAPSPAGAWNKVTGFVRRNPVGVGIASLVTALSAHTLYRHWKDRQPDEAVAP